MKHTEKFPRLVYHIVLDGNIIYVGSTSQTLMRRLNSHRCDKLHPIFIERKNDLSIEQIDIMIGKEDLGKEREWIIFYQSLGLKLLNKNIPTFNYSKEEMSKILSKRGRIYYLNNREKCNRWMVEYVKNRRKTDPETRRKWNEYQAKYKREHYKK